MINCSNELITKRQRGFKRLIYHRVLGISAWNISGNWKDALLTDRMPRTIFLLLKRRGMASSEVIVSSL